MASNYENHKLRTLLWIVSLLERHKKLTLKEINWHMVNDEGREDEKPIQRRTFFSYINSIQDLFGIVIECNPRDRFRYSITMRDDDKVADWLMKSMQLTDTIASNKNMADRIVLEDVPSGQQYLDTIFNAMRSNCKVSFTYKRFHDCTEQKIAMAAPYCVKIYHQRWYVVMKEWRTVLVSHDIVEEMHVYSLDRILSLTIEDETFEMDPLFDAQEFFRYAFGTRVEKDNPPQVVRLKVVAEQCGYFRTLPLHHSQREVETTDDYSIFELDVALTIELILQIQYYGSLVEVLDPQDLRDYIATEAIRTANLYAE